MKKVSFLVAFFLFSGVLLFSGGISIAQAQTCATPNTCVNSASGCPSGQTNVSAQTPCTDPGRICCAVRTQTETTTTPTGDSAVSINVSNPLKYDTVEGVLTSIMTTLQGIVVTLAILMIVIGAIMYILSAGNADRIKTAKNIILAALVGLAIVLAAPAFLKEIYGLLGGPEQEALSGAQTLTQIAQNILNFLLSIIGVLALIMLVISGIMYLTSAGNESRMKTAKNIFVAALIGIAVAMGSLILVTAVAQFFR